MSTPIVTPDLLQRMRTPDALQAPALPAPVMSSSMPNLAIPAPPLVTKAPNAVDLAQKRVNDLHQQGSGIDQIHNPLLRGLARAGDITASVFGTYIPGIRTLDATLPGTTLHHQVLVGQAEHNLANAQENQRAADADAQAQAQTAQEQALTDYTKQRPAIEEAKVNQKITAANNRNAALLAQHGFTYSVDPDTNEPTIAEDPNSQAYRDRQTLTAMHQATADKDQIQAEIAQNHYVPGTPEYAEAQRKLAQVDERLKVALGNLGLRHNEFTMHAFGTVNGQELPGVLHDEEGIPVGSVFGGNVKPTTTARDAASRAEDLTAIQSRIEQGLKDPEIAQYMGPIGGRLAEAEGKLGTLPAKVAQFQNDLVSYGAFQAGLHPVRGIGALEYFDKVMGGLHQTPEQLRGKLASNAATAGTVQQEGTMPTKAGINRKQTAPNAPSTNIPAGPKAGDVVDGYKFKGGNPADQKNWVKQ